jgi:hypothetical protein
MIRLSLSDLRSGYGDKVTWTLEEAAKHFREVTVVNAYQEMVDRIDGAN